MHSPLEPPPGAHCSSQEHRTELRSRVFLHQKVPGKAMLSPVPFSSTPAPSRRSAAIPGGPRPGSWASCPWRCAPREGTRCCGARWWAGAGGTAWTGPAALTARAGCPAPTPRGPPRPPSARGPAGREHQPQPQHAPKLVAIRGGGNRGITCTPNPPLHLPSPHRGVCCDSTSPSATGSRPSPALCPHVPGSLGYLEPIFGSLLQVGDDGVIPQVDEPSPEILDPDGAGQEEAGTCRGRQRAKMGSGRPPAPRQPKNPAPKVCEAMLRLPGKTQQNRTQGRGPVRAATSS